MASRWEHRPLVIQIVKSNSREDRAEIANRFPALKSASASGPIRYALALVNRLLIAELNRLINT